MHLSQIYFLFHKVKTKSSFVFKVSPSIKVFFPNSHSKTKNKVYLLYTMLKHSYSPCHNVKIVTPLHGYNVKINIVIPLLAMLKHLQYWNNEQI